MEVGKKYKYLNYKTIYEVIYKYDDGDFVVSYGDRQISYIPKKHFHYYLEYIEPPKPVVHTRYIYWWVSKNLKHPKFSVTMTSSKSYKIGEKSNSYELMQIDEVTFTEYPEPIQKETKKRSIVNCEKDCERRGNCTCE